MTEDRRLRGIRAPRLAGVEPLLEAPAASQSLLNNWSMGSGTGAADAAAQ